MTSKPKYTYKTKALTFCIDCDRPACKHCAGCGVPLCDSCYEISEYCDACIDGDEDYDNDELPTDNTESLPEPSYNIQNDCLYSRGVGDWLD